MRNRNSKTQQENSIDKLDDQNPFDRIELSIHEEENWKKRFDLTMDPREWVARNGHGYISGDYRFFKYRDEELKNWLYKVQEILRNEELEALWSEFLTEDEIIKNRKLRYDLSEDGP